MVPATPTTTTRRMPSPARTISPRRSAAGSSTTRRSAASSVRSGSGWSIGRSSGRIARGRTDETTVNFVLACAMEAIDFVIPSPKLAEELLAEMKARLVEHDVAKPYRGFVVRRFGQALVDRNFEGAKHNHRE